MRRPIVSESSMSSASIDREAFVPISLLWHPRAFREIEEAMFFWRPMSRRSRAAGAESIQDATRRRISDEHHPARRPATRPRPRPNSRPSGRPPPGGTGSSATTRPRMSSLFAAASPKSTRWRKRGAAEAVEPASSSSDGRGVGRGARRPHGQPGRAAGARRPARPSTSPAGRSRPMPI